MIFKNLSYGKIGIIILLVCGILYTLYYNYSKQNSLNIKTDNLEKIGIMSTPGDYFELVEEEKVKMIVKKVNKIKIYPSNELPGESSPYASITLYYRNDKKEKVHFYGGVIWYNEELYTAGWLTNRQLEQLVKDVQ